MGNALFKQPNGRYGRYSYTCDDFTDYNMTKEEWFIKAMVGKLNSEKWDFKHNQHFTDYKSVLKDAKAMHTKLNLQQLSTKMKENCEESYEDEFYKQLYLLFDSLVNTYDIDSLETKDYNIIEHENELKTITQKLKEINELFKTFKNE